MERRLLFIDANIWLDFYRTRSEAGLSLLSHLETIQDRIIVTYQLEMEFKKHRQEAILESVKQLKGPDGISRPALFSDAKTANALKKDLQNASRRVNDLKKRLKKALNKPVLYDPVYKVCQRIFHKQDDLVLSRAMNVKRVIRSKALRRFLLGYPPRKQGDTSMGDALNWEWIVKCAESRKADVYIVSRDSDYGVTFEEQSYINDHLFQEFKDRVSQKRKVLLFSKLSNALKAFQVSVSKAEEDEETVLVERYKEEAPVQSKPLAMFTTSGMRASLFSEALKEFVG